MLYLLFGFMLVTGIAASIAAYRSRQRMGKALGRKVDDRELTSISTWMDVDAAEKDKKP